MEEIHIKTLQKNRAFLVKNLNLDWIRDELVTEEVMCDGQWEIIDAKVTKDDKVRSFLDTYTRCGPEAYDILEKVLNDIPKRRDITERLRTTYEQLLSEGMSLKNHGFRQDSKDIYKNGPMRILIINNEFEGTPNERKGSAKDVENLENIFRYLGYLDITTLKDIAAKELETKIDHFLEDEKTNKAESCVFVISSHGDEHGAIQCSNGYIYKDKLIKKFNRTSAQSLKGKPKLLMFQCCRGEDHDDGIKKKHCADQGAKNKEDRKPDAWEKEEDSAADGENVSDAKAVTEGEDVKSVPKSEVEAETEACHNNADMLIVDATSDGEKAWRGTKSGSLMIKHFCEMAESMWKNEHMADILTKVTNELGTGFNLPSIGHVKQQVTTTNTLRRKWYLRQN